VLRFRQWGRGESARSRSGSGGACGTRGARLTAIVESKWLGLEQTHKLVKQGSREEEAACVKMQPLSKNDGLLGEAGWEQCGGLPDWAAAKI